MRCDLFVQDRYNILTISDKYRKSFICILLKHCYTPHINNPLLIPDLFVKPMMRFYDAIIAFMTCYDG